jgi:light-harvesting complex 1 beta chain
MAYTNPIHSDPALLPQSRQFSVIFLLGFAVLLFVACAASMLFLPWRSWLPGAEGTGSMFGAVKAATYTFMSYLN